MNRIRLYIRSICSLVLFSLTFIISQQALQAQKTVKPAPLYTGKDKKLAYTPDSLGNRIPDFSYCGYKAGEQAIPTAIVKLVVPLTNSDATLRIQSAIDYVSKLPADKNGLRGAVLLQKGLYHVNGILRLHTSGVVLRGSGAGDDGTILSGDGKDRKTLVQIAGKNDQQTSDSASVTDEYAPVNSRSVNVNEPSLFKKGDNIIIFRPSTKEWIDLLGTDHFGGGITSLGWKPGQRNLTWYRTITSIEGNKIQFDAPLTTAVEKKYGGAKLAAYTWPGRITNTGIENIQLRSSYDTTRPMDEDHRWMAITMDNVTDAWVRQVTFKHFAGSAVAVYETGSRVTIEDCQSLQPVSEIGGERRNSFFTTGQQILFQRCYAEYGMHDFATGFCAAGPVAFVQCDSKLPYSFSGGIDSWSSGVLFDVMNVDGNTISLFNRGQDGQGAGWNLANSVCWNCSAARIDCYQPPGANNWAFASWSQFAGDGYWGESNNSIDPRSLYYAQLKERTGAALNDRVQVMDISTDASSSPTAEVALALTKVSVAPAQTVLQFINKAAVRQPINVDATGAKTIDEISVQSPLVIQSAAPLGITNGWIVRGKQLMTGARSGVPWWNGSARPYARRSSGMAITRFVPGRTGRGWTDDLDALTDTMLAGNIIGIEQNYGLWYERRRDDHERIRRMDGDVWAPFYELPFARSGQGTAWDGLSKYDLTRYNYWYWNRLKTFADLADQKGLVLVHQDYFQHNIIEAGAHYTDFPWRPANNINNTGFPEPPPYAGDKRIFMAEQFYDTTNVLRRDLHQKYIRQCLDNFSANNGVIQLIGEEFTGPLPFVQFWLNTIRVWQKEHGHHQLIGLATTKDVQDAILNDAAYAGVVDVIDIRYWYYQADGAAYTPQGGQNLAPRQHARLLKPKATSPQQVYRAVLEYKQRFPSKAVIYSADAFDKNGWAVLMAGGSLPNLAIKDAGLVQAIATMQPQVAKDPSARQWILMNENTGYIVYDMKPVVMADLSAATGNYEVNWISPADGTVTRTKKTIKAGKMIPIDKTGNGILWLKKVK